MKEEKLKLCKKCGYLYDEETLLCPLCESESDTYLTAYCED